MSRLEVRLSLAALAVTVVGVFLATYARGTWSGAEVGAAARDTFAAAWDGPVFSIALRVFAVLAPIAVVLTVIERATTSSRRVEVPEPVRRRSRSIAPIDQGTDEVGTGRRAMAKQVEAPTFDLASPEALGLSRAANDRLMSILRGQKGLVLVACRQSDVASHVATLVAGKVEKATTASTVAGKEAAETARRSAAERLTVAPIVALDAASGLARLITFVPTDASGMAQSVLGAMAVLAVPRLCGGCRQPKMADLKLLARAEAIGVDLEKRLLYEGTGCGKCGGRGHSSELLVSEVLPMTAPMIAALASGRGAFHLASTARAQGYPGLREELVERVSSGDVGIDDALTALEELR